MQRFGRKAKTPEVIHISHEFWLCGWSVSEMCTAGGSSCTDSF